MASRRYGRGARVGGVLMLAAAVPLVLAAACASSPASAPTPDPSLNPAVAPHDERITLPETMGLALRHPMPKDRTERQILYTVQQSVRSRLHAEYGSGVDDPLLAAYWSGDGLAAVKRDVADWVKTGEQAAGVLVVSEMTYTAPNAGGKATVSYCADWQNVNRDAGTAGTYTTLTVERAAKQSRPRRWTVTAMTETPNSPRCKSSAQAR